MTIKRVDLNKYIINIINKGEKKPKKGKNCPFFAFL